MLHLVWPLNQNISEAVKEGILFGTVGTSILRAKGSTKTQYANFKQHHRELQKQNGESLIEKSKAFMQ